jgi:hypothetical protein
MTKNEEDEMPYEARREFERAHKEMNNKIAGCLSAMITWLGDPMTIEHGILDTLTWAQKKELLNDMREALQ